VRLVVIPWGERGMTSPFSVTPPIRPIELSPPLISGLSVAGNENIGWALVAFCKESRRGWLGSHCVVHHISVV